MEEQFKLIVSHHNKNLLKYRQRLKQWIEEEGGSTEEANKTLNQQLREVVGGFRLFAEQYTVSQASLKTAKYRACECAADFQTESTLASRSKRNITTRTKAAARKAVITMSDSELDADAQPFVPTGLSWSPHWQQSSRQLEPEQKMPFWQRWTGEMKKEIEGIS